MRALLDVNVLIALLDRQHVHSEEAWRWFERHAELGWASCPITQNGCVRIMSQSSYINPYPMQTIAQRLQAATQTELHQFWPDDVSLLDPQALSLRHIHSAKQLTDAYLLSLAVANKGRLVTFDRRVGLAAVPAADKHSLLVI